MKMELIENTLQARENNLKMPALTFSVNGKQFENGAF